MQHNTELPQKKYTNMKDSELVKVQADQLTEDELAAYKAEAHKRGLSPEYLQHIRGSDKRILKKMAFVLIAIFIVSAIATIIGTLEKSILARQITSFIGVLVSVYLYKRTFKKK